jgi:hypothetical protein
MKKLWLVTLFALSCTSSPDVRVDVSRGVPASELSFELTPGRSGKASAPVAAIQIASTDVRYRGQSRSAIWSIARRRDAPELPLPVKLRYGQVPPGFGDAGPAPVLTNGKYEVRVQSNGVWSSARFRVTDTNTIE